MNGVRATVSFVFMPAFAAAIVFGGCMEPELSSSWPEREISIDGKAPEWAGREAFYSESECFKIGVFNDADYLYLYLATWQRQKQMQILTNGLTVWIDATGRKEQRLGINYPMKRSMPDSTGMPPGMAAPRRADERSGASPSPAGESSREIPGGMLARAREELAVLGPAGESITSMPAADDGRGGPAAMIDISNRTLIYELRLPLESPDGPPFAVKAVPGAMIGIGIEIGKSEMPSMKGAGRGGPPGTPAAGGGMGGPGGGMGGPGDGMGGRGRPGGGFTDEAFEFRAKVRLAADSSAAPAQDASQK